MDKQYVDQMLMFEAEVKAHIVRYLTMLFKREQEIVRKNLHIIQGGFGNWAWYSDSICYVFVKSDQTVEFCLTPESYMFKCHSEKGIEVSHPKRNRALLVPYNISADEIETHFATLKANLKKVEEKNRESKKERAKQEAAEKKLMGVHVDGKYTYHWESCKRCSSGKIMVGTGVKAHQGAFDQEGDYRMTEVMEERNCPECQGHSGFLVFEEQGRRNFEKKVPMSKWKFEENQDDFIKLLTN